MTPTIVALLWADGSEAAAGESLGFFNLAAALIALTALFAYLNHRFVRLPPNIGVMALALMFSLVVIAVGLFVPSVEEGEGVGAADRLQQDGAQWHAGLSALRRSAAH